MDDVGHQLQVSGSVLSFSPHIIIQYIEDLSKTRIIMSASVYMCTHVYNDEESALIMLKGYLSSPH